MARVAQPQEQGAEERAGRQVERACRLGARQAPRLLLPPLEGQEGEAHRGEIRSRRSPDELDRSPVARPEGRAKPLVPADDLPQARGQGAPARGAPRGGGLRACCKRRSPARADLKTRASPGRRTGAGLPSAVPAGGGELPTPGSARPPPPGRGPWGSRRARGAAPPPRRPRAGERPPASRGASGRRERRSRPRLRPARRPSTSPQIPASDLLGRRSRRDVRRAAAGLPRRAARAAPAVELAVRRQRQPVEDDERRRHHVLGQRAPERRAQRRRRSDAAARGIGADRVHVGHEPRVAGSRPRAPATAASRTPGCAASAASISPSSMRKPRTLTWWSSRPRNSSSPSAAPAARSPVR